MNSKSYSLRQVARLIKDNSRLWLRRERRDDLQLARRKWPVLDEEYPEGGSYRYMNTLRWLDKNFERVIMAFFLAMITILMAIDVTGRYIFRASPAHTQEMARYCMLYITFLGMGYGIRYDAHIKADILSANFPKLRPMFEVISDIGMLVFSGILVIAGVPKLESLALRGQVSPSMGLPMVYLYAGLEVGWALCIFRIIQKYVLRIVFKKGFNIEESDRRTIDID
jgi:TRAP-type C4-dicarboxylate transport system permease small subunit